MSFFGVIRGIFGSNEVAPIRIDASTHTIQVIDYAHHEIHSGSNFFHKNCNTLGNGGVIEFLLITPDTDKEPHFVFNLATEAECTTEVFVGTTYSAVGTAIPIFNRNGRSANVATLSGYTGPTITTDGTSVACYKTGSGKSEGGDAGARHELILAKNQTYLMRITNDTTNTIWIDYLFDWYEHTPRD